MTFLMDITKSMFISIINVIPGVSGEAMAVSLDIYDKLISSISDLLRDWKGSLAALLSIILGCGIGIVGLSYAIELLLSKYTFVTCMAFVGPTLGGISVLVRALRKDLRKRDSFTGVSSVITFLALLTVAVLPPALDEDTEMFRTFMSTVGTMISLFLVGIIASATIVVPGVSGSLMMMILGYYYGTLEAIRFFIEALKNLDTAGLSNGFLLLFPLGVGVLLDIFLIAKLITFLFGRYGVQTYCVILGLIVVPLSAIFRNTGLFEQLSSLKTGNVLVDIVLAIAGAVVIRYLGEQLE